MWHLVVMWTYFGCGWLVKGCYVLGSQAGRFGYLVDGQF